MGTSRQDAALMTFFYPHSGSSAWLPSARAVLSHSSPAPHPCPAHAGTSVHLSPSVAAPTVWPVALQATGRKASRLCLPFTQSINGALAYGWHNFSACNVPPTTTISLCLIASPRQQPLISRSHLSIAWPTCTAPRLPT